MDYLGSIQRWLRLKVGSVAAPKAADVGRIPRAVALRGIDGDVAV